nr:phosphate regulon sensor histidine kinase PhoR [Pseudomonas sp.]
MVWLRSSLLIVLVGVLALLTRATSGPTVAWIVFSSGLVLLVMLHVWHLSRALKWAGDLRKPPPTAGATWGELLVRIHRHLRKQERDIAEAREAVQTWLAASQALPDGVVILDENLHIDWCNREARRYLGLRLPADRGQNLLNLVRGPEFVRYAQQADWPEPTIVPAPGNAERLLLVQLIAYGRRQRLLVARDVTQLERMETTRRDFVANVSHELRTPLTVLTGFLETLREAPAGALDETQTDRYFDMMSEQAQRMLNIVADLLTLSTLESSRTREYPGPAGMATIIDTVKKQAQALSGGRHTFVWNITPGLEVLGESSELSSAVSNLVTNALRYTPESGTITVTWEPVREGGATFAVTDTGIGIDPQHLPRLTERFYRVDRSRSRASGGTGLGLAITKHVALRHDAELEIASEPGHGSTFALQFPPDRIQYAGKKVDSARAAPAAAA